ncbi:hypothetical protein V8F20_009244 [Naviculisporaceae sp. PSN 640]
MTNNQDAKPAKPPATNTSPVTSKQCRLPRTGPGLGHQLPKTFNLRPNSGGSSLHGPVKGDFVKSYNINTVRRHSKVGPWATYKYCLRSEHFPPSHQGQFTTARDSPWFGQVYMEFNNMDVFAYTDFDWMHYAQYRCEDSIEISYDAHYYIKHVAMYERVIVLDFRALRQGQKNNPTNTQEEFRNSWTVTIQLYARREKDLHFYLTDLRKFINPDTCVCLEASKIKNINDPLSDKRRFYIKYPILSATPEGFIESLDRQLDLDVPDLWKVVDDNFERQLYCLTRESVRGGIKPTASDGGEVKKKQNNNKKEKQTVVGKVDKIEANTEEGEDEPEVADIVEQTGSGMTCTIQ